MAANTLVKMCFLLLATSSVMLQPGDCYTFCNMTGDGLNACKPAVTQPPAEPSASCCSSLSGADLPCLCNQKKSNPMMMSLLGIDPDLALALPPKCNLTLPAQC